MPPKRAAPRAGPEPAGNRRHGAAIRSEMPPLPSRMMTSYGSESVAPLLNIRSGRRRVLGDAIGDALRDSSEDPSDLGSMRMSQEPYPDLSDAGSVRMSQEPPQRGPDAGPVRMSREPYQDPLPDLVPAPDRPSESLESVRESVESFSVGGDDFLPPPSEDDVSPPPSPEKRASPEKRNRGMAPPSTAASSRPVAAASGPASRTRRARASATPVPQEEQTQQAQQAQQAQPARRVTRSSRSVSANPQPQPQRQPSPERAPAPESPARPPLASPAARNRRAASTAPEHDSPALPPLIPPTTTTTNRRPATAAPLTPAERFRAQLLPPDVARAAATGTDRSFSLESDIFRGATIDSPQRELSTSPPVPSSVQRSGGSLRERLARARGTLKFTTNTLTQGRDQARNFLFGPRGGAGSATRPVIKETTTTTTAAAAPNAGAGTAPKAVFKAPSAPVSTGSSRPPSSPSSSDSAPEPEGSAERPASSPATSSPTGSPLRSPPALRLDRLWRIINRSTGRLILNLLVAACVIAAMLSAPSLYDRFDVGEWDPAESWHDVTVFLEPYNPFMSSYNEAAVDAARGEYKKMVKQSLEEIERLQASSKAYEGSVKRLEDLMPQVVHMEVKGGKRKIPDDFWHALRDSIVADEDVVSIQGSRTGPRFSSEKHWDAVLGHISDDMVTGKRLASRWDEWLRKNRVKVVEALQLDELAPAPSLDANMKNTINALIKERLRGPDLKETVVTREEFVRHIRGEFATHRQEIHSEMMDLEARLDVQVQRALEKALGSEGPISARETKRLVRDTVNEELGKAQLGALARGEIHKSWGADLQHRVNFLAVGTGAVVNPLTSSPTYKLPSGPFGTRSWISSNKRAPPLPHNAVLLPWDEAGDAWCGSATVNRKGEPNGVTLTFQLGNLVTPEHIVVEHILPDATLDPGARPREVEVWAQVDGVETQKRLLDFAAAHFPPRGEGKPPAEARCEGSDCYYLIGRFEYESNALQGGVFVQRLSGELGAMGVRTDQVRVVATSNYGDEGKTCFYRVRLYGEVREERRG